MKFNEFYKDLEYSLDSTEDKIINEFYKRYFPNLEEIQIVTNLKWQKKGIDKVIKLKSGKSVKIDEKKRREDYNDILLEEWSVFEKKKIGWTGDPEKAIDFIAYIVIPTKKIYMFPYDILQLVWRLNSSEWKVKYGIKVAPNHGYCTYNIAVPTDILLEAIKNTMVCSLDSSTEEKKEDCILLTSNTYKNTSKKKLNFQTGTTIYLPLRNLIFLNKWN